MADCVEALIGAYLIECGPRGALLFMAWLGIRVLPKEEVILAPDHPFLKIMEQAMVGKGKDKTDKVQTVENRDEEVRGTGETTIATKHASDKDISDKVGDTSKDAIVHVAAIAKDMSDKAKYGAVKTTTQNKDASVGAKKADATAKHTGGKVNEATGQIVKHVASEATIVDHKATSQLKDICIRGKDVDAMSSEGANLKEVKQLSGEKKVKKKRKKKNAKSMDSSVLTENFTDRNDGASEVACEKISDRLKNVDTIFKRENVEKGGENSQLKTEGLLEVDGDAMKSRRKRKNRKKRKGGVKLDETVEKLNEESEEFVEEPKESNVTLEESDKTVNEIKISVGECTTLKEIEKTVKESNKIVKENQKTVGECSQTVKESDKALEEPKETIKENVVGEKDKCIFKMCIKKSNVLPKFIDEMDIWCGDEVTDEDSCSDDEEPGEVGKAGDGAEAGKAPEDKDPYDSEDDESELEDDWNWDHRVPGSLKPQKNKEGRWIQVCSII